MMNRNYIIALLTGFSLLVFSGIAFTVDMPHGWLKPTDEKTLIGRCNKCHSLSHNALGASYTRDTNSNLCISCHKFGEEGSKKHFSSSEQADLVAMQGTSHRWDSVMPAEDSENNPYGLRSYNKITNGVIKGMLDKIGLCSDNNTKGKCNITTYTNRTTCEANGGIWTPTNRTRSTCESTTNKGKWTAHVVCSTCHNQHSHNEEPWNPDPDMGNAGVASGGTTTTIIDNTRNWEGNKWVGAYIKMTSGSNNNQRRKILSNTANSITVSAAFTYSVAGGNSYVIMKDRNYMRISNNEGQLCEACHYYMTPQGQAADIKTWNGRKKSHPVGRSLQEAGSSYHPVPLDANLAPQAGAPRYHLNAEGDTNLTNNLVMDAQGRVRCMTCHGIHYTDSNTETEDQP